MMAVKFNLRAAGSGDAEFVFRLSNDVLVRRNSANSKEIRWEDHVKWFARMLESPDCIFFIVESDGVPIGQVRFNRRERGWECSGSLLPAWRGKGLSARFLRAALIRSGLPEVVGMSKVSNRIAIKPLLDNGYEFVRNETLNGEEYEVYRYLDCVFTIAEMSANHRGDFGRAKELVAAAAASGADAVKLQTYTADTMTLDCKTGPFLISGGTLWDGMTMHELYGRASTPWGWTAELKAYAESLGIELFSTPFDKTAVDFLEGVKVPRYKIASFEAVDIPLIRYTAAKGKPMLISVGVSSPEEMQEAVDACFAEGNFDVTLLKCTSAYPAKPEKMHLATIRDMVERFGSQGVRIGLSDHSLGPEVPVAAVALGARVIEKHLTLDRPEGDAESSFALTPNEFGAMVKAAKGVLSAVGDVSYAADPTGRRGRRSLFVAEDMKTGEVFTERNVRSVRPGDGCDPKFLPEILGKRARCDLAKGTPMKVDYVG